MSPPVPLVIVEPIVSFKQGVNSSSILTVFNSLLIRSFNKGSHKILHTVLGLFLANCI